MRHFITQYETEIRLGLSVIVILLLLLNFGTTYVFYQAKQHISENVDNRILSGLNNVSLYLKNNETTFLSNEQAQIIRSRFNIKNIIVYALPAKGAGKIEDFLRDAHANSAQVPVLSGSDLQRLINGDRLFRTGANESERIGLMIQSPFAGKKALIVASCHSDVLSILTKASRMALILAIAIILCIVPLTIGLPRIILRPFKKMRQTAEEAGKLLEEDIGDEVQQIIRSYEENIAQLRQNEEELTRLYAESSDKARQLEKLNKYILKSIGSGVVHIDLTGKVTEYNRAAEDILDYDSQDVLGKHYLVAFSEYDELNLLIEAGLLHGETTKRRELELRRAGQLVYLGIESSRIFDDAGSEIGLALLFTDLTELRKLQAELETNKRMATLGEMTAGLAHQLRNSLAAISGFAQLLKKKADSESLLGDLAGSIHQETLSAEEMVNRFLSFSKPLSLSNETFDIIGLLKECLDKKRLIAIDRDIIIDLRTEENEIFVTGDRLLLKEAIGNVVDNAFQVLNKSGKIDIIAKSYDTRCNILICDNGPGIPEEIMPEIFTPFVSSRPSGTGLGLALTHKIITLHNGSISFTNRTEGGAMCHISLPVSKKRLPETSLLPILDTKKR